MNKRTKTAVAPRMECPLTADPKKKIASDMQTDAIQGNFPSCVSRPALRALISAGYTDLAQLVETTEVDLLKLHGMGPKAVRLLSEALSERALSFRESPITNTNKS